MARFFIDRPIFSSVISLVIALAGLITYFVLPIEQFPDIVPPTVSVTTSYPGANSTTLANTVAVPLEQQINGVDDMIYFQSASDNSGNLNMTVTFDIGTNPDMATVNVSNRVQQVNNLPKEVQQQGVIVQKQSTSLLVVINLFDKDAKENATQGRSDLYLSNYASIKLKDVLGRIHGVGQAKVLDAKDYGMRIWLNPDIMAVRQLSPSDVISIIEQQNAQVAAGKIGQPPVPKGQEQEIVVTTLGRLTTVEQFENLTVRTGKNGEILKLKDIARVELGAQTYNQSSTLNGQPSATIGIYQSPGANAIAVVKALRAQLKELEPMFERDGVGYLVCYDATNFVDASLEEVKLTLLIAIVLVVFVVFIFLQDWRAALIPTLSIPVSLLGAFALMSLFGFSINTLSLFGIILVIGIVVDDTIVVVEDCQRLIDEEDLSPKEAAYRAMNQVTGPVVATALVLMAVFIPTAMMPGIVGRLYAQFALTIAGATAISAVCALSLAPALSALLLRKSPKKRFFFFAWFNKTLAAFTKGYLVGVSGMLRVALLVLLLWGGMIFGLYIVNKKLPTGFLPDEDQGVVFVEVRLADGASLESTRSLTSQLSEKLQKVPGVENVVFVNGMSMVDNIYSSNVAVAFLPLTDWKERKEPGMSAKELINKINNIVSEETAAKIMVFGPPPIMGLGSSGGVQMQLLDKRDAGSTALYNSMQQLLMRSMTTDDQKNEEPIIAYSTSSYRPTTPLFYLDVNREKVKQLDVSMQELNTAIQTFFGSYYINDFNAFDRVFKVMAMADGGFRRTEDDLKKIHIRNEKGQMLPINSFLTTKNQAGTEVVYRYNMFPSTLVTSQLLPGKSTGEGMQRLTEAASELDSDFGFEWTNMSYQEAKAGSATFIIFGLAIVFAFLVLAAQYESWSAPLIIMMAIPLAICGAFGGIMLRGLDVNVYTQVGLVILIGLSAKNSILIVEFARDAHKQGMSVFDSAMEAAKLRLRPILMTSFAFILGVAPLVIAEGAGAMSRQAIGTAVFFGMSAVTCLGIFVTPTLYLLIQEGTEKIEKWFHKSPKEQQNQKDGE